MRICITRSERYSYSETFIRDQIAGFSKLAEVFPIHSGRFPERSEDGKLLNSRLFWVLGKIVKVLTGDRSNYFSNYGFQKFLEKNQIDVVLANYGLSGSHVLPTCRRLQIPLIVIFHGHDATDKKLLREYASRYRELFKYATVVAVSQEMRTRLIAMGARADSVRVVACGVDPSRFTPAQTHKENLFIAVGRMVEKKGPLYTIRAFHMVWKKHPDAKLLIIGSKKGLYHKCVALVNSLGMQSAVEFSGIKTQQEVAELMSHALAFVQHSVTASNGDMEGTPVSVLEASASGLPVVSTLHGGIKDAVLHGKTGFLVAEGDVTAMAAFMMKLIEDPKGSIDMGNAGRRHIIENYKQENQIGKLYDLALRAIDDKNVRAI